MWIILRDWICSHRPKEYLLQCNLHFRYLCRNANCFQYDYRWHNSQCFCLNNRSRYKQLRLIGCLAIFAMDACIKKFWHNYSRCNVLADHYSKNYKWGFIHDLLDCNCNLPVCVYHRIRFLHRWLTISITYYLWPLRYIKQHWSSRNVGILAYKSLSNLYFNAGQTNQHIFAVVLVSAISMRMPYHISWFALLFEVWGGLKPKCFTKS